MLHDSQSLELHPLSGTKIPFSITVSLQTVEYVKIPSVANFLTIEC